MAEQVRVEHGGRELALSNLGKLMYPAAAFTKSDVIRYYAAIAPVMLPHLIGRPITMVRFPDGVDGESFFEKRCPGHRPAWIPTARVGRSDDAKSYDACLFEEEAALVWAANMAALELHPPLARADDLDRPTFVVFDLDPGAPAGVGACVDVALDLRAVLQAAGLECFVKTSGSKGLHVAVPLNPPAGTGVPHDVTRDFALAVGQVLARRRKDVVIEMERSQRRGRVFIDWSQNARHKTTVAAYSLRGRDRPTVSPPLTWDELVDRGASGDDDRLSFEAPEVIERVERVGDPFAPVLELRQSLPRPGRTSSSSD